MLLAAAWQRLLVAGAAVAASVGRRSVGRAVDAVDRAGAAIGAGGGAGRRSAGMPTPVRCVPLSDPGWRRPAAAAFDRFDVTAQPIVAPVNARGQVAFYATVLHAPGARGHLPRRSGARHQGGGIRRCRAGRRDARGIRGPSVAGAERGGACGVRCADRRRSRNRGDLPRRRGRTAGDRAGRRRCAGRARRRPGRLRCAGAERQRRDGVRCQRAARARHAGCAVFLERTAAAARGGGRRTAAADRRHDGQDRRAGAEQRRRRRVSRRDPQRPDSRRHLRRRRARVCVCWSAPATERRAGR